MCIKQLSPTDFKYVQIPLCVPVKKCKGYARPFSIKEHDTVHLNKYINLNV